jgi:cobalt-zinc-cadmium resistance protein CzcA
MAKALQNNKLIKAGQLQIDKANANIKTAYSFDKTNVYYSYDENNLALNNIPIKVFGIQQRFNFPTVYGSQKNFYSAEYEKEKAGFEITKNQLSNSVAQVYNQIVYLQHQEELFAYLDSLYQNFSKASDRRFELGETNYLEKITAQSKFRQIRTKLSQLEKEKGANYEQLQALLQSEEKNEIKTNKLVPILSLVNNSNKTIYNSYFEAITKSNKSNENLEKQQYLPDINLEYFQGTNSGLFNSLKGFQVGLSVPILLGGTKTKTQVAKIESQSWEQQKQNELIKIDKYISRKNEELLKYNEAIKYYNEYGEKLAKEIIKVANLSYKHGEIDFFQYITSLENATTIQVDYLENVYNYNRTQFDLQFLTLN